jgi:polar amino acid transport system substrate-binding protein
MMRIWKVAAPLAGALVLATAGCGSSSPKAAITATTTPQATTVPAASPAVIADLASTGKLRFAAPASPPFLASTNPAVAVSLAQALAGRLGVAMVPTVYPQVGALLQASGSWDVAVVPVLPTTTAAVDQTAALILLPHTLLVGSGSPIQNLATADTAGLRIASVGGDPHTPVLAGQLKHAQLVKVADDATGLAMLKAGQVDAFASARFALMREVAQIPGSRLLDENFFTARFALAVPHGHAAGVAYLSEFVEELRASGAIQQAISSAGLQAVLVAPAATPSANGNTSTTM